MSGTKLIVNLPGEAMSALRRMAKSQGTSMTEMVRRSLLMEDFLLKEQDAGKRILIKNDEGTRRILVL